MIPEEEFRQQLESVQTLANSNVAPNVFYETLLAAATTGTQSLGAVAWDCDSQNFKEFCHHKPEGSPPIQLDCSPEQHNSLLQSVVKTAEAQIAVPQKSDGSNSTDSAVLAVAPVSNGKPVTTIVEVFLRNGLQRDQYKNSLNRISELCQIASVYENKFGHQSRESAPSSQTQNTNVEETPSSPLQLHQFANNVYSSLDFRETIMRIANAGRSTLSCDRVSVVKFSRNKSKVVAVNGHPKVNRRANVIQKLERLSNVILPTKEEFVHPQEDSNLPSQIETPLHDYLSVANTRGLIITPIFDRRPPEETDDNKAQKEPDPVVIGALVVENFTDNLNTPQFRERYNVISQHASNAYRNSHQHKQLFLFPLWDALGRSKIVTTARNLPITLSVLAGILILVAILALWPAEFKIVSDGKLIPTVRQFVFANVDGQAVEVKVDHDSEVAQGESILVLKSNPLELQLEELYGRKKVSSAELDGVKNELLERSNPNSDQLEIRQVTLETVLESIDGQLAILEKEKEKLNVKSPLDGNVITWNVKESLENRPIKRGEILMEIADLNSDWRIELDMPDRRIGHIASAQKELGEDLKVEFIVASDPSKTLYGKIVSIGKATEIHPELGQTIRVNVEINKEDLKVLQTKTGVTAKVHCGKKSLGYVLFHDILEFVQSKMLFRVQ